MAKAWKGTKKTIAEIRRFGAEADRKINLETEAAANLISRDAKQLAPKNFGKLAQSISISRPPPSRGLTTRIVTVNEFYGAYMEFGTGLKFKSPPEFAQMANSFRGQSRGTFDEFVESMKIWMRHKGYDEKNAWIACINILNDGQNPRPFLYPAWFKGKIEYQKNLKQLLKNLKRNI